jgi:phospholipid/cholesterol/gamma-HCH transport system substrate-binding protein
MTYLALVAAKAKWALAFASVVGLSVFLPHLFNPVDQTYRLRVPLENAAGLYPGSDVEIAGAKVGRVDGLTLQGGVAVATLVIDPAYAPVHTDASIDVRPKSLLGEQYVALDPGHASGTLPDNYQLPLARVDRSVSLEDVFNTLDQPTRQKLQIAIDELGGGFAGEGDIQNQGLSSGRQDLDDLSAIAATLAQKDQELKGVIASLSQVTDELAQSDRRTQLGELIKNTEDLMRELADQDAQLQRALTQTNAALAETDASLQGTGPNLNDISQSLLTTVTVSGGLTNDLGLGMDTLLPHLNQFIAGVKEGPYVFGGNDGTGYATRVDIVAGAGTFGAPSQPPPPPAAPVAPGVPGLTASDLGSVVGFILATPAPPPVSQP